MFARHAGILHAEDVSLDAIADAVGTPVYVYSAAALRGAYRDFAAALEGLDARICYALKANSNQAVLRLFGQLGAGMDVVSEGEFRRVRAAGIPASRITFSGVGKTAAEIALALDEGVFSFNVESEPELRQVSAIAAARGRTAAIALRVNPDVDAQTHAKITTGTADTKFGVPLDQARALYAEAATLPGLRVAGVDMHIGSQITELDAFADAFAVLAEFVGQLRQDGHTINHLDLGGGLGIPYYGEDPAAYAPSRYATLVRRIIAPLGCELVFEPGRLLVGNAGVLLTEVIYNKAGAAKTFVVVDAAMNDLIRPTLYEAHHAIEPVRTPAAGTETAPVDVVGPVCESGDYLALGRSMPLVPPGARLAVRSAGAYGAVQAGTYNSRLLVPEVLVDGDRFAVIRPRLGFDELIALDRVPDWLLSQA